MMIVSLQQMSPRTINPITGEDVLLELRAPERETPGYMI
jgi:hypothetical protein